MASDRTVLGPKRRRVVRPPPGASPALSAPTECTAGTPKTFVPGQKSGSTASLAKDRRASGGGRPVGGAWRGFGTALVARKARRAAAASTPAPTEFVGAETPGTAGACGKDIETEPRLTREVFPAFPFTPYDSQRAFMKQLYSCVEDRCVGIFESPTGTGKTLSIICSALQWQRDRCAGSGASVEDPFDAAASSQHNGGAGADGADDDWIAAYSREKAASEKEYQRKRLATRLEEIRSRIRDRNRVGGRQRYQFFGKARSKSSGAAATPASAASAAPSGASDDESVILDDWGEEVGAARAESSSEDDGKWEDDDTFGIQKVFLASRTHSQLSQFVNEIKKTPLAENMRVVQLGSRKTLCINTDVSKLGSDSLINDRCLELQEKASKRAPSSADKKGASTCGCKFLKRSAVSTVRDEVVVSGIRDIEELAALGKQRDGCPYYASRRAVPLAEVVALPYAALLHRGTRSALGLDLKNSVIIVDEAHNLIDAINATHAASVTHGQLVAARSQLRAYLDRYSSRLRSDNRAYVAQLILVVDQLSKVLVSRVPNSTQHRSPVKPAAAPSVGARLGASSLASAAQASGTLPKSLSVDSGVASASGLTCGFSGRGRSESSGAPAVPRGAAMKVSDLLFEARIDHVNFDVLLRFIEGSNIVRKLRGFANVMAREEAVSAGRVSISTATPAASSPLLSVVSLLAALDNHDADARVIASRTDEGVAVLKVVMLNPAVYFREVVDDARSVILAGGTMEPVEHVVQQLFGHLPADKVRRFSCDHVMPPENLVVLPLARGPTRVRDFDFRFDKRSNVDQIDELGRTIAALCSVVPGGLVCFVPSYSYLAQLCARWETSGTVTDIEKHKRVFQEPREAVASETTLRSFTAAVGSGDGAVLMCVVGAKMSEGINFSDDLARCVVVVGLPYANKSDPELAERLAYEDLRSTEATDARSTAKAGDGPAAHRLYDSLCMKAVNQSIGRSIRHRNDYAVIVLVDVRYTSSRILGMLPRWIRRRVPPALVRASRPAGAAPTFSALLSGIRGFFASKRSSEVASTVATDPTN